MSEPGREPECWQVPARSPKDLPWRCRQERKRKLWPVTWEARALLWGSATASSPGKGEGAPSSALPTSKCTENSVFLLVCLPRLSSVGDGRSL